MYDIHLKRCLPLPLGTARIHRQMLSPGGSIKNHAKNVMGCVFNEL